MTRKRSRVRTTPRRPPTCSCWTPMGSSATAARQTGTTTTPRRTPPGCVARSTRCWRAPLPIPPRRRRSGARSSGDREAAGSPGLAARPALTRSAGPVSAGSARAAAQSAGAGPCCSPAAARRPRSRTPTPPAVPLRPVARGFCRPVLAARRGRVEREPRIGQRRERAFQALAQRLKARWQRQELAQVRLVLVHREPGSDRRDLEQHPAGLAEVHRAKVEAIDHLRRARARGGDARAPLVLLLRLGGERHVVHRARALERLGAGRWGVVCVEASALIPAHLPAPVRLPAAE